MNFGIIVFAGISVLFICLCKKVEKSCKTYDTTNCRNVRANLGLFTYVSDVEAARAKVNHRKSKF